MNRPIGCDSEATATGREDAEAAIRLATELLTEARELQTPAERRQQSELDRMINSGQDKATLIEMTDQAFRTHTPARVADQLTHLLDAQGIPRFFSPVERAMLRGFQAFGEYLPGVAVPLVKDKMRQETANVILPAEPELLAEHLRQRQQHGVRMNVNLLGEALLGEAETARRLQSYLDALRMPEVRCLSVKISTLYSQVSAFARRHTIAVVSDRLEKLYREAIRERDHDTGAAKFVYLDMEEYRDLYLTADVLKQTLGRDGLDQASAGIALQAYVPDSFLVMEDLIEWSRRRVENGGTPLKIRLVKGANMELERVEASIAGWPQAPYTEKVDTDANFKRMLQRMLDAAAAGHLRVGVASHNLFEVALAMIWTRRRQCDAAVDFEMLEGMANHQRRAISDRGEDMLLYAPACGQADFLNAIGYLIRRLDENTGPENFLRYSYRLTPDSEVFDRLAEGFRKSLAKMDDVGVSPRRTQDRRETPVQPAVGDHWTRFVNEPDTDWSLPHNAQWMEDLLEERRSGQRLFEDTLPARSSRPSRSEGEVSTQRVSKTANADRVRRETATLESVLGVVQTAKAATSLTEMTPVQRHEMLRRVAQLLRERRGELIAGMVESAEKTVSQADPEVSEAIDFCEFYPLAHRDFADRAAVRLSPRGVVAVITPWNFPLAIPCGGVAAALAAGNAVILKPAKQTIYSAVQLCEAFWDAGVPRDALQLVVCDDDVAEEGLVTNSDVETVILTGGTATARRMLEARPGLHLLAETGGKNATIVTAMADRDLAVKHVVDSAFGHSGQKCSATSLLLLEDEVYHDEDFREKLADAVRSLHVGSPFELHTKVTPLLDPPNDELRRGLTQLDDDESWLVEPEARDDSGRLFSPGVRWNVRPGSFCHQTELFGPVLSVMRFGRLEEAIGIIQATGYGLTSGLESLDDREIELWTESTPAGNLYINRGTTGAIVLRQPFGGVGLSAYGPGVKAGGPHYTLALSKIDNADVPLRDSQDELPNWLSEIANLGLIQEGEVKRIGKAVASQRLAWEQEFSRTHDTFNLIGQHNLRRYRPPDGLLMRVQVGDRIDDVLIAIAAAVNVNTPVTLSIAEGIASDADTAFHLIADHFPRLVDPVDQNDDVLIRRIRSGRVTRIRSFGRLPVPVLRACGEAFVTVVSEPVIDDGRIECLWCLNEQSISHDYHRYGNLGRAGANVAIRSANRRSQDARSRSERPH